MHNILQHLDRKAVIVFGAALLGVLGFFFYWIAGKSAGDASPITELPASTLNAALGRELLVALAQLKSTKLDTSVFDDPVFDSLKDFGVEIAPQPVGRKSPDNPFAPFPSATLSKQGAAVKLPVSSGAGGTSASGRTVNPPPSDLEGFDLE